MSDMISMAGLEATPHPPSPWRLKAQMLLGLSWVRTERIRPALPEGVKPFSVFGWSLSGVAFVDYGPQGGESVLSYRELLVAILVRRGLRVLVHIPQIWVDSAESLAGGRKLWAIPKEWADFEGRIEGPLFSASQEGVSLSAVRTGKRWLALPGWISTRMTLVQARSDGRIVETPNRMRARVEILRGVSWDFSADSPLTRVSGQSRPFLSLFLRSAQVIFGRTPS